MQTAFSRASGGRAPPEPGPTRGGRPSLSRQSDATRASTEPRGTTRPSGYAVASGEPGATPRTDARAEHVRPTGEALYIF